MQTLQMASTLHLHLSLNVSNLDLSVKFYKVLFGTEPVKVYQDYAKFELEDPPLVLSLEPQKHSGGGALNHLGFRMPDSASLVAMQQRLELAGIRSQREEGVECCYAKQTKFWVTDPDNNLWEIYTFEGDLEHRGPGQTLERMLPHQQSNGTETAAPVVWEHRLGAAIPERILQEDSSVDQVLLRGTFNVALEEEVKHQLLQEARRVLRPGGKLFVHVLTAERPLTSKPNLPGPAAVVQYTPLEHEPPELLQAAGFEQVEMIKFSSSPCFVHEGIGLRELQLIGYKPASSEAATQTVLYKGPFQQIMDDLGHVYPRGQRVTVSDNVVQSLRSGPFVEAFVIFEK